MESRVDVDAEELRSGPWPIPKTDPTQHPSKPPSIVASAMEPGMLARTFLGSLAARISIDGLASAREMPARQKWKVEPWEEVAIGLFWMHHWRCFGSFAAAMVEALCQDGPCLLSAERECQPLPAQRFS